VAVLTGRPLAGDILVVNAGSTSLKLSVVDVAEGSRALRALEDAPRVSAVGHRVVHGGAPFSRPAPIDDDVLEQLTGLVELAPLHNAPAIRMIAAARAALPDVPHVAVFDTAFHRTLPEVAATYPIPKRFRELGVRRYGFHGLSVQWAAERVSARRLVVCHLGGGASVTAVCDGRSIDTTMGFTPLEGVPMATRAGSVDPGALLYLLEHGVSVSELAHALEYESGLTGLAGTGDVETLENDASPGAQLALDVYCYRVAQAVAAMATALGGVDALAFTAGVGERSAHVRAAICRRLGFLGIEIDARANAGVDGDAEIGAQSPQSRVRVHVIAAREDVMIARAVRAALSPG
jgi:acetate kinase